jgi:GxxExxY protein
MGINQNRVIYAHEQYPEKDLTEKIIGAAIEVHRHLGPGLLESIYQACMEKELELQNIQYESQKSLPVDYKGLKLDIGYRLDLLIENKIIVEIKTVDSISPVHEAQMLTYLKLTNIKVGLLINFNVPTLIKGVKRLVL